MPTDKKQSTDSKSDKKHASGSDQKSGKSASGVTSKSSKKSDTKSR